MLAGYRADGYRARKRSVAPTGLVRLTVRFIQPLLVHGVDVERRVGEDEVEAARGVVRVVVVAVDVAAVFDFAFEAVDGYARASCGTLVFSGFHKNSA